MRYLSAFMGISWFQLPVARGARHRASAPRPLQQDRSFPLVLRHRRRAGERGMSLLRASEPFEQVAPDGVQQVVAFQRLSLVERLDDLQAGLGTERTPDRHGTIQLDDRGWHELGEGVV